MFVCSYWQNSLHAVLRELFGVGLAKSGKVSSANGVIDASGYFLASVANAIFSGFMGKLGWKGIITIWWLIMFSGAIIAGIKKIHIRKQAFSNQE
jgi:hypothetical protein